MLPISDFRLPPKGVKRKLLDEPQKTNKRVDVKITREAKGALPSNCPELKKSILGYEQAAALLPRVKRDRGPLAAQPVPPNLKARVLT